MCDVIGKLEGRLPAQLTAAACMMRLSLAEMQQKREEPNPQRAKGYMGPYCSAALSGGWFGPVVRVMRMALKVLYWP